MKDDAAIGFNPFGGGDFAIVGFGLGVRFAETAKIGVFHNDLCRLVHAFNIGFIAQQPRVIMFEGILIKMYVVFIRP